MLDENAQLILAIYENQSVGDLEACHLYLLSFLPRTSNTLSQISNEAPTESNIPLGASELYPSPGQDPLPALDW